MKTVASNRRARYDYDIIDTIEAGILLHGQEVKSCRAGNVNLAGAYVSFLAQKPTLKGCHIAPYRHASNLDDYTPERERTLLLHKKEIAKLHAALAEKGVSLIPIEMKAGRHIKVILGLGKGKKRHEKKQKKKETDIKRRLREGREI